MIASAKTRALAACFSLVFVFTGYSFRLVDLQVTKHAEYANMAADNHGLRQTIPSRRGAILAVNDEPLAENLPVKIVVADGSLIKDRVELAKFLSKPLEMSENALLEKLSRERWSDKEQKNVPAKYIVLKKDVPETVADDITQEIAEIESKKDRKDKKLSDVDREAPQPDPAVSGYTCEEAKKLARAGVRAITFQQDSNRVYPNHDMLCHVVGFVDAENKGMDGVEKSFNETLEGHDGIRFSERDRTGKELVPYRGEERPPRDGSTVRLTVDLALQNIVETELNDAVKQYQPKMAVAVMMRPQTGEILALANRPDFDPNDVEASPMGARRNRAVIDQVEPGSIFKIVSVSGALQQHIVQPDTMIPTENGYFTFLGRTLKDTHPFRELSVHDILVHSSNIGAAKLGMQLGEQRLYEHIRKFGFGDRTGVQLPGEIKGVVHSFSQDKLLISRVPMGQGVCVTPIQITTAMCAIANGGTLVMPQIVHDVIDCDGKCGSPFAPVEVRRVISREVAGEMRDALIDVMSRAKKGTGKDICVRGFQIAGKTGTAQKVGEKGVYEKGKYVVSFLGFMPAANPQFVCLVMLDDCVVEANKNYGGTIAGPIFAKIAERTARHLGLEPSAELMKEQDQAKADSDHARD